jgi:putative transposase
MKRRHNTGQKFVEAKYIYWRIIISMKAYKFKLKPSPKIVAIFDSWLAICCELYNAALQERRDAYQINHLSINYTAQANQLPEIKSERSDLARVHSQVVQNVLKRVDFAFENFFRRVSEGQKPGYPRFRSGTRYGSFTYPQSGFSIKGKKLHLSKIGKIKLHLSRPIEGQIKTCMIKRQADGWYVIFAVDESKKEVTPAPKESVGVDVGIESYATLSDDEAKPIENPQYFRRAEHDIKRAGRRVSRRVKGSKRRKKAVRLLAKKHLKVKRQRRDFHFKEALKIVAQYQSIKVEDLNIRGMVKNHRLAKSISDAGWGQFIMIIINKAEEAGRSVIKVNPSYTSQECSRCGNRNRITLATRIYRCARCELVIHRDRNGAKRIEQKGRAAPSGSKRDVACEEPRTYQATDLESPAKTQ